jgi:hypothetical protein
MVALCCFLKWSTKLGTIGMYYLFRPPTHPLTPFFTHAVYRSTIKLINALTSVTVVFSMNHGKREQLSVLGSSGSVTNQWSVACEGVLLSLVYLTSPVRCRARLALLCHLWKSLMRSLAGYLPPVHPPFSQMAPQRSRYPCTGARYSHLPNQCVQGLKIVLLSGIDRIS